MNSAELLEMIRSRGGRVFRHREAGVFVLTQERELAEELVRLGARYEPVCKERGYLRTPDYPRLEWDVILTPLASITWLNGEHDFADLWSAAA